MLVKDFIGLIDRLAPFSLAPDWDNSGLQVGDPKARVKKVALALEATSQTIEEAINQKANLLIVHHPLIFKPLKNLNLNDPLTSPIIKAIFGNLAVIAAHTNWDAVGVAKALAETLGLTPLEPLTTTSPDLTQLTVYAPSAALDGLKKALFSVGVGQQGDYAECSYESAGLGQFKPQPGSQPYTGQVGVLAQTDEVRLEMVLPTSLIPKATHALRAAHPYEEPAFHFTAIQRPALGFGLIAKWSTPQDPLAITKAKLGLKTLNYAGPTPKLVQRVALLPGSGGDFILPAHLAKAEVLITGEINHHQALLAEEIGLTVLAAGHYETEKPGLYRLGQELENQTRRSNAALEYTFLSDQSPWRSYGLNL
ncbi:MAG: Nif3-like dinuclear metal center hexameric protein [Deltaproteobacteria bacterium]|jgi:dinuclear metal center YbgI/SA1388 family protein|nr:Nif3-like dinuclear metal center hexameric protein [Deltaproteobacteria bacterium]